MDERDEREDDEQRPARTGNEGVRIIGAEEAAAALEKGEVVGRRPEDAPRFGDVPAAPSGPRPPHRFPLPDSVDPASAVPRPPVVASGSAGAQGYEPEAPPPYEPRDPTGVVVTGAGEVGEAGAAPESDTDFGVPDLSVPAEGLRVGSDSSPELQHWTDPPTGEVPRVLSGGDPDDLSVWSGISSRAPRWRDSSEDWDEDFDVAALADDEARVGALDSSRSEHSDIYDFDEPTPSGSTAAAVMDDEEVEAPRPATTRIRTRARKPPNAPTVAGGNDGTIRIVTGVGFGVVALICFVLGTGWLALLSTVVVLACAFEVFDVLRRAGYLPATLLGLVATVSLMGGTYWKGERAIPLVLALTIVTTFLWYLFGVVRARPTVNVAATFLAFCWVAVLGSFATLLLQAGPHHHGVGLLYGPVLCTIACDVGSFVAGRTVGTHPLMPEVSPNKTWEGALGGLTGSVAIAVILVRAIHPWNLKHAALLGLMIAVVAPLGDLCESLVKRDLGLKDMGSLLPGHGGVLDRMDGMLFVLPATYYLAQYLHIH